MSSLQAVVVFNLFVLGMLALDLGVFHRRAHAISFREASLWSGFWVVLSLAFNLGLYFWRGPQPALEFLTGYILEKSLSLDNVFLFAVIFSTNGLPPPYQHKVLFWGVLGALAMRAVLIGPGVALISRFGWILCIFGIFLVITGATLLRRERQSIRPERNPLLRLARRVFPITEDYKGASFFLRRNGRLCAT
jgi:tellurite resistance protein TerC